MGQNLGPLNIKDTYQSLVQISGSVLTDGSGSAITSITGVTASYATSASHAIAADTSISASYATTASFALNVPVTASYAISASHADNADSSQTSNTANTATTASYAITASYALNVPATASYALTASYVTSSNVYGPLGANSIATASRAIETFGVEVQANSSNEDFGIVLGRGDGLNFPLQATSASADPNSYGISINPALNTINLKSGSIFNGSYTGSLQGTASFALNVTTPNLQQVTDAGATTTNAITTPGIVGGYLIPTSGDVTVGGITGDAYITAGGAGKKVIIDGQSGVILSGSVNSQDGITAPSFTGSLTGNSVTANTATFTSASIGFLSTVTGSATIIGDAYIILNTSDATRYAGIKVEDSGSATPTNYTASLNFDSQTNDWFYEYSGSDPTNYGVAMFGPEYGTKGSPSYPTANTLVKGNGGHHLNDSSITDDGTTVNINADISASGFVSASTYYGDGSQLTGVSAFPYTGSAGILGDLELTGSVLLQVDNATDEFLMLNPSEQLGFRVQGGAYFGDTNFQTDNGYVNFMAGERNVINGGQTSFIGGARENTINNQAENAAIIGGNSNTLGASRSTIQAATTSTLTHTGTPQSNLYSAIIGGQGHTLDGYSGSVILGGNGITANAHHTVFVPTLNVADSANVVGSLVVNGNIEITGSVNGNVTDISAVSNTGSIDCSLGNFFTHDIQTGADTYFTATNIQPGQTINLRLTQDAATPGTVSWNTSIFKFEGGTPFAASTGVNDVDVVTLISFDGSTFQVTGLKDFS